MERNGTLPRCTGLATSTSTWLPDIRTVPDASQGEPASTWYQPRTSLRSEYFITCSRDNRKFKPQRPIPFQKLHGKTFPRHYPGGPSRYEEGSLQL
eukprot:176266-Prymnesium_polylepis.1